MTKTLKVSIETEVVKATKEREYTLPVYLKNDFSSSMDERFYLCVADDLSAILLHKCPESRHYLIEIIEDFEFNRDLTVTCDITSLHKTCKPEDFDSAFSDAIQYATKRLEKLREDEQRENIG